MVVSAQRCPDGWTIAFRDNGVGVAPEDRERIFEPFARGSSARSVSGSGIGLAACRRIVESHGGAISVDSVVGQGSTFLVQLRSARNAARLPANHG